MSGPRVHLQGAQHTMLMTLAMHAQDAASVAPILGDRFAADVLDRVDHAPPSAFGIGGNAPAICTRAAVIDDVARRFLDDHGEAVVLHLGCGLDSRVLRLDPGPGVQWFDVDQEPVIALRRALYDERPHATMLAASVTDPTWWAGLPTGIPRLVLAEGLLMYLDPDGVRTVVDHALDGPGLLLADTVAPWMVTVGGWQPAMWAAGTGFRSSTDDLAASAAGLTLRDEVVVLDETARRSGAAMAAFLTVVGLVPGVRRAMVLRTYEA